MQNVQNQANFGERGFWFYSRNCLHLFAFHHNANVSFCVDAIDFWQSKPDMAKIPEAGGGGAIGGAVVVRGVPRIFTKIGLLGKIA